MGAPPHGLVATLDRAPDPNNLKRTEAGRLCRQRPASEPAAHQVGLLQGAVQAVAHGATWWLPEDCQVARRAARGAINQGIPGARWRARSACWPAQIGATDSAPRLGARNESAAPLRRAGVRACRAGGRAGGRQTDAKQHKVSPSSRPAGGGSVAPRRSRARLESAGARGGHFWPRRNSRGGRRSRESCRRRLALVL